MDTLVFEDTNHSPVLMKRLLDIFNDEPVVRSQAKLVGRWISNIAVSGLITIPFSSLPFEGASFRYSHGSHLEDKVIRNISAAGSVLCVVPFSVWGWVKFFNELFKDSSPEEQKIIAANMSQTMRAALVSSGLILGVTSQWALLGIEMNNMPAHPEWGFILGLLTIIADGGVPAYSTWLLLEGLNKFRQEYFNCGPKTPQLLAFKKGVEKTLRASIPLTLSWTPEERKRAFACVYQKSTADGAMRIQQLFEDAMALQKTLKETQKETRWISWPRKVAQVTLPIVSSLFLYEMAQLTISSCKDTSFLDNPMGMSVAVAISTLTWVWVTSTLPAKSLSSLWGKIVGLFTSSRYPTPAEVLYPTTHNVLSVLAAVVSVMPFGEIFTVADGVEDWDTTFGKILIPAANVTLMSFFFHSLLDGFEQALLLYGKKWGSEEKKEAIAFKEKIESLVVALEQSGVPDFATLLHYVGDYPDLADEIALVMKRHIEGIQDEVPLLVEEIEV